jgi:hypothetical protein
MLRFRKRSISIPGTTEASARIKLCVGEHMPLAAAAKKFLGFKPEVFYRFVVVIVCCYYYY